MLDQRNLEMTAAKRYRQGSASKAADDDIVDAEVKEVKKDERGEGRRDEQRGERGGD